MDYLQQVLIRFVLLCLFQRHDLVQLPLVLVGVSYDEAFLLYTDLGLIRTWQLAEQLTK